MQTIELRSDAILSSAAYASALDLRGAEGVGRLSCGPPSSMLESMGKLLDAIRAAVREDRWIVSWHADERCEEREVAVWQVVVELEHAELVQECPDTKPNPTVIVRELLAGGREIEVVWSWLSDSRRAKLVTVYFPD